MILEPKHLFAYAPHGVNCQVWQHIVGYKNRKLSFDTGHDFYNKLEDGLVRIFLRPLSDLTKEIEVNGEKFIPMAELLKLDNPQWLERHPNGRYSEIEYSQNEVLANAMFSFQATLSIHLHLKHLENERNWKIEKLKEWHFDIFGLIDAGLAVDVDRKSVV